MLTNLINRLIFPSGFQLKPYVSSYRNYPNDYSFLVSYPKSGSTWLRFMLADILSKDFKGFENINAIIPGLDDFRHWKELNNAPYKICKSHHYFNPQYQKVVLLVRDPRSVCVSQYFFLQRKGLIEENTFKNHFHNFLYTFHPKYGNWGQHTASWVATSSNHKPILIVKYEELLNNPSEVLGAVLEYLDIEHSQSDIEEAVEKSSFNKMRNEDKKRDSSVSNKSKIPFVRKSDPNEWKEYLSADMEDQMREEFSYAMNALSY